jgi:hypothetical protein
VKQFVDGNFPDGYSPTIESTATKTITYNGTEYPCEIIDTAGEVGLLLSIRTLNSPPPRPLLRSPALPPRTNSPYSNHGTR